MPTTTHLVCAPDDLLAPAVVTEWLAHAGSEVAADRPLVRLAVAGETLLVLAPMAGILTEHCVAIGEPLAASDLLAMIEAEEQDFGFTLLPADITTENLSVPACRLASPASMQQAIPADAMALCAALGIAPDEVIATEGGCSREQVEHHVRRELRLLAALRELLQR